MWASPLIIAKDSFKRSIIPGYEHVQKTHTSRDTLEEQDTIIGIQSQYMLIKTRIGGLEQK